MEKKCYRFQCRFEKRHVGVILHLEALPYFVLQRVQSLGKTLTLGSVIVSLLLRNVHHFQTKTKKNINAEEFQQKYHNWNLESRRISFGCSF